LPSANRAIGQPQADQDRWRLDFRQPLQGAGVSAYTANHSAFSVDASARRCATTCSPPVCGPNRDISEAGRLPPGAIALIGLAIGGKVLSTRTAPCAAAPSFEQCDQIGPCGRSRAAPARPVRQETCTPAAASAVFGPTVDQPTTRRAVEEPVRGSFSAHGGFPS